MNYETIIGLEVHAELSTASKIFCSCSTEFGQPANSQCCPVCLGLPGALPVLNRQVVDLALRLCLALRCQVSPLTRFDRKNYFYPDLPKAYQISQLHQPIGRDGQLQLSEHPHRLIRIHEIHMEEDAGKLIHDPWTDHTLVDYNRCGVPLLEIVSEPDLRSAEEAIDYLMTLRQILMFCGISDCRMEQGSLRADVNVSVRPAGSSQLGIRTEMKNMNSFKAISRAIISESQRQAEEIAEGRPIIQQTRRWDENKDASFAMRTKENAMDYRYFPDPDLVAVRIDSDWLDKIRADIPEMPAKKRDRYQQDWQLTTYEAEQLTSDPALARLLEQTISAGAQPADAVSWILGEILQTCKAMACTPEQLNLPAAHFARLLGLVSRGEINRTIGRQVLQEVISSQVDPLEYIEQKGLRMVNNQADLQNMVDQVVKANPQSVRDFISGKKKAKGYLIGQVMQKSRGKADPIKVGNLVEQALRTAGGKTDEDQVSAD